MTFSSLISGTIPSHSKYNIRPGKVTRIIQHHWGGTSGGIERLSNPLQKASATYLVLSTGQILGQVPEEFRPWTSGGPAADNPSITIECQNSTGAPDYKVSDAALNSIERLIADIAKRHGFGALTRTNYRGHREFAATACPGPYLYPRLQAICDAANGTQPAPTPTPTPTPVSRPNCTQFQSAIRTGVDNSWGSDTDKHADALRAASMWGGHKFPYGVAFAQLVVGTAQDGKWGPHSIAAHDATVINVQNALRNMGFDPGTSDGKWGPNSEGAYQAARRACHI
jgi:hypothetical protein